MPECVPLESKKIKSKKQKRKVKSAFWKGRGRATTSVLLRSSVDSTSADLQSFVGEGHADEAGAGVGRRLEQGGLDAGGCFGVFGDHIEEATATGSRKLESETVVAYPTDDGINERRIGSRVEGLVLQPGLADECAHGGEVFTLDGFIHVEGVTFHLAQYGEAFG